MTELSAAGRLAVLEMRAYGMQQREYALEEMRCRHILKALGNRLTRRATQIQILADKASHVERFSR